MSRHLVRLLLCSVASVALIAGASFTYEWFRVDFGPAQISIDLREAHMCAPNEACKSVSLATMNGFYPMMAIGAFWGALALGLLVVGQCLARVFAGSASVTASRLGYVLASAVFLCAFGAGYLFAPETDGMFGMMGASVNQTFAPPMLLAGCLFALLALRYALLDAVVDEAGEYKPIVLEKPSDPRLPVTPLNVKPVPAPRAGTDSERTKAPSQQPAPRERTKAPSQQPPPRERAKTASDPPTGSGTAVGITPRTKTASQQPLVARTVSPNEMLARTKSMSLRTEPDDGPTEVDPISRTHTSSSGPIDLAARLSGAPIAVAIKPPLPEPVPVPPDQIPVAPESGLVIRKRTPSSAPLTAKAAQAVAAAQTSEAPVEVRRKTPTQMPLEARTKTPSQAPLEARRNTPTGLQPLEARTKTPTGRQPMSAIGRRITDDFDVATPIPGAMPMHEEDMTGLGLSFEAEPARVSPSSVSATGSSPPGALPVAPRDLAGPPGLRGTLNYAVSTATLSSVGIEAHREDGTRRLVAWEAIVGIIARRLPSESPYDGSTFVDLVSTAGSTLRFLPWTKLAGAPINGDGEDRARAFVQLVAARCLDAKLDSWTKVFADGVGKAAQLPSAKTLAAHDDRLA